uniref:Uncharacterized protein n=1 Tax=Cryptomonas curvata TaxID=233186 RepID=A0A7S0QBD1_9CRYP
MGLTVEGSMATADAQAFLERVNRLGCGETALVAWEHTRIPDLIYALDPPNAAWFSRWPTVCPSPVWPEPAGLPGESTCYDLMWVVPLWRNASARATGGHPLSHGHSLSLPAQPGPWCAGPIQPYREGFVGDADGECSDGLAYMD